MNVYERYGKLKVQQEIIEGEINKLKPLIQQELNKEKALQNKPEEKPKEA